MPLYTPTLRPGAAFGSYLRPGSGYYYPTFPTNSLTTALQTANRTVASPFFVPYPVTLTRIGCEVTTGGDAGRSVADMVTNGTTTVTSATAAFVSTDVGRLVTGTNIANNTIISSVTNSTTAVLSAAATGSGSGGTLNISGVVVRLGLYADDGQGLPGALVFDAGVSGTANTNGAAMFASSGLIDGNTIAVQEITISLALGAGNYWAVHNSQGKTTTAPTLRTVNAVPIPIHLGTATPTAALVTAMVQQTSGTLTTTLPDPFVPGGAGNNPARMFVKVT